MSTQNLATHSSTSPGMERKPAASSIGSTYGAVYQPTTHTFYTLSPTTVRMHDGERHLRILSFRLPTLRPIATIDVPGAYEEGAVPTLMLEEDGQVGRLKKGHYSRIEKSHLLSASIPSIFPIKLRHGNQFADNTNRSETLGVSRSAFGQNRALGLRCVLYRMNYWVR